MVNKLIILEALPNVATIHGSASARVQQNRRAAKLVGIIAND